MNLMTWSLAGLLAFEAASAPAGAAKACELTDNRCKAELFTRRAREAKNDGQRALYLSVAHRSWLALFDRSGDPQHLCAARRLYDRSVAIKDQPPEQRASIERSLGDLRAREQKAGVRCERPVKPSRADPPLLVARGEVQRGEGPSEAVTGAVDAPPSPASSPAAADNVARRQPMPEGQVVDELLPVSRRAGTARAAESRRAEPARGADASSRRDHDRELIVGGGVTLGLGLVLAGVATYTGASMLGVRRQARELHERVDGHATDAQLAQDAALRRDYERLGTPTLVLALAGGAATVVGAVLLAVGGRRVARRASQTAVIPVPGGVAFRARF